jgi:hypothetical protein
MANLILRDIGDYIFEAEVLDAFRRKGGLQVKLRVDESASPINFQLRPEESTIFMNHYDVTNPNYLTGKHVSAHYSKGRLVGLGLNQHIA